ncbi:MAG: nitroreductase family protein [Ndongobacter sp.]|nr:nitroreductase family protein [Ndongobacter sp.]
MSVIQSLEKRRSYYHLNKKLPVPREEVTRTIEQVTELVPDAFNMKSARVVVLYGEEHDAFWQEVYRVFDGAVAQEKIDSFKAGAGTVLYFTDAAVVKAMEERFALYAENFPVWANQANGMLQINVWTALRELGIGASLQHYNPVIDGMVRERYGVPEHYVLLAEMPFGGIEEEPEPKEREDISKRVQVR